MTFVPTQTSLAAELIESSYETTEPSAVSTVSDDTASVTTYEITNDTVSDSTVAKVPDKLTVTFANVNLGDCIILECGGEAAAIDGGESKYRRKIDKIAASMGIEKFKFLVNTHPHFDHYGGLKHILKKYEVGDVYINGLLPTNKQSQKLRKAAQRSGKELKPLFKDDVLTLGSATITVLGPSKLNTKKGHDATNNNSLILMVKHGSKTLLLTGDALVQEQNELLDDGVNVKCDVLKIPHHGIRNALNDRFYDAASPSYAVCSCPKAATKGKRRWITFSRITADNNINIFATGKQGNVVMVSDGEKIEWNIDPAYTP